MSDFILEHELSIRLTAFFAVFAIMALWEIASPCRELRYPRTKRWLGNIGIVILNSLVLRLLFPAAAVGMAAFTTHAGWGVLNAIALPFWLSAFIAVLVMDMVIYLQHVMVHAIPMLWRLHRVHHADPDYDLTTGARFHPIEIILSMLIKIATIAALGPPVVAVVIFEVLLNGMAMFNHANIRLPSHLDRVLRWIIVTPDMHRVHHSVEPNETNSNFGFNLSLWDRMMGTYCQQPRLGQQGMDIGLSSFRDPQITTRLTGMLMIPFLQDKDVYSINKRSWKSDRNPGDKQP
ncbi:sterol desaturase family protein [Candidatus Thiodiazotropha sp. CDECU1]|uniref:sterol desaturase family protein n=1 Tax=Candidatus Thiodiazotropha sp. CDECU1 TaxID=3065865 RepID=UPI00292DAB59|nr:sterol desaturase family protein [Candidatus Thiodiazotropha sp. CDECU1]